MEKIAAKADIGKIEATGSRLEILDSLVPGLRLRVWPTGVKKWSLLYRTEEGAYSRLNLGVFGDAPDLTLAAARKLATAKKVAIANGHDPQKERRLRRETARAARAARLKPDAETVEAVALQCIEALKLRDATRKEWTRLAKKEIGVAFSGRLAKELTRAEIKVWTRKLAKRNGWIANRAFSLLRRVYSWAASDDVELIEASPLVGMKKPFADEVESERVLSGDELRALLRALDALDLRAEAELSFMAQGVKEARTRPARNPKRKGERLVYFAEGPGAPYVDACRLLLLTGVRRSAVIGAKRSEFEGLDTPSPQWVVPGGAYGRSKNLRPHVVPLSEPALDIVLRRMRLTKGAFLFPVRRLKAGQTERDRPMTWDSHFVALLKDTADRIYGAKMVRWTIHNFRAAITTNSREQLKVAGDVAGGILGHKKPGAATARIYDRSELLDEKRAALVSWAAWLQRIKASDAEGAKVLPFKARA